MMAAPLILLLACADETPVAKSRLEALDPGAPERVLVAGAGGVGAVQLPVRLVSSYGAAVPGTSVEVSVSGEGFTLESATLQLDTDGHAFARVLAEQPGSFTLTVTGSADGAQVGAQAQGVALGAPTPTLPLDDVLQPPSDSDEVFAVARGSGGLALASTSAVWWMPGIQGGTPWTVLTPPFAIDGVRSGEVDADGVRDLVVWGEDQVVLLRGRPGGGWSWGAGWRSTDARVVGAVLVDGDGDGDGDVVLGLSGDGVGRVELLEGDGAWGFAVQAPLELEGAILDVMAADEDRDQRVDVMVIDEATGWLQRYTQDGEGWIGGSPALLDQHVFRPGSELLPSADLDGDGLLDVIALAEPGTSNQAIVFYDLGDDLKYQQAWSRIWADVDDVDEDGGADILVMEDGILHRIRYDFLAQGYIVQNSQGLASAGPTSVGDVDGDGVSDLAVLDAAVVIHKGQLDPTGAWSVGERQIVELAQGLDGPFELFDVDGDGDEDIVGFVATGSGAASMRVWRASYSDDAGLRYEPLDGLELNATGPVLDLAHCDPDWYVLADNVDAGYDEPNKLFRLRIAPSTGLVPVNQHGDRVRGSMLTCGTPDPSDPSLRRMTVASPDGHWTMYAYNVVPIAEGELGPAFDIANADLDGDGLDELYGCGVEGCRLVAADMDADGTDELLRQEERLTLVGWGQEFDLGDQGQLAADDVDGDGVLDVLISDAGGRLVTAIPTLTGALGPALGWATTVDIQGPIQATDGDADGQPELVWQQGDALYSSARTSGAGEE